MKINEKNNKASKNSNIDDKQISKDFSEIFDISENNDDLSTLFIDARVKKGLTQEDVSKILKVRVSAIQQIETGEELQSLGSAYSLGFLTPEQALVAFTTSMAAASADTMASEIGVLSPSPVLITNPRKIVEPGVDGGISFEGLTASFLSSVSISMLAYAGFLVLIEESHAFSASIEINYLFISVFFGFFGSVFDSFLGATLQSRDILSNNGVNLASISISVLLSLVFLGLF